MVRVKVCVQMYRQRPRWTDLNNWHLIQSGGIMTSEISHRHQSVTGSTTKWHSFRPTTSINRLYLQYGTQMSMWVIFTVANTPLISTDHNVTRKLVIRQYKHSLNTFVKCVFVYHSEPLSAERVLIVSKRGIQSFWNDSHASLLFLQFWHITHLIQLKITKSIMWT